LNLSKRTSAIQGPEDAVEGAEGNPTARAGIVDEDASAADARHAAIGGDVNADGSGSGGHQMALPRPELRYKGEDDVVGQEDLFWPQPKCMIYEAVDFPCGDGSKAGQSRHKPDRLKVFRDKRVADFCQSLAETLSLGRVENMGGGTIDAAARNDLPSFIAGSPAARRAADIKAEIGLFHCGTPCCTKLRVISRGLVIMVPTTTACAPAENARRTSLGVL